MHIAHTARYNLSGSQLSQAGLGKAASTLSRSGRLVAGLAATSQVGNALRNRPQGLEQAQLEAQRAALDSARQQQQQLHATYSQLRDSFLAVHTALSPHNLSVAFGFKCGALGQLGLSHDAYEALTSRMLAARELADGDADLVVARVREVLAQVRARWT